MAWTIGGNLNFGGGAAGQALANPQAAYASAYQESLNANKQNYGNILAGYQQAMARQQQEQKGIAHGYDVLQNQTLGAIQNLGQSRQQQMNRQYAQQQGLADQQLINRGLGNTTIQSSVNRGLAYDRSLAQNDLTSQLAQQRAGVMSQFGLANLNYQGQATRDNAALANRQLDWMNSVNIGYPNMKDYADLAQQRGANRVGANPFNAMPVRSNYGGIPMGGFGPMGGGFGPVPRMQNGGGDLVDRRGPMAGGPGGAMGANMGGRAFGGGMAGSMGDGYYTSGQLQSELRIPNQAGFTDVLAPGMDYYDPSRTGFGGMDTNLLGGY